MCQGALLALLAPCSSSAPYGFHGNRPIRLVITPHVSHSPAGWALDIGVWYVCMLTYASADGVGGRGTETLSTGQWLLIACFFTSNYYLILESGSLYQTNDSPVT